MAKRDIIVIGASAGGVYALKELVAGLPADFGASIFIVQHVSPHAPSLLPKILEHVGYLPVHHPEDGELVQPGHIYVAPPDHHLLIEYDQVIVKKGPKENRFRPSIDALFRSAAYRYGSRVIGVVLTGLLDDGTSGLWTVKRLGGLGIIQSPEDALYASMPRSVLEYVEVDHIVPMSEMAELLVELTQQPAPEQPVIEEEEASRLEAEINIAAQDNAFNMGILDMGALTPLTCPECNGSLVSIKEGKIIRYRCHTGHAFTASSLLAEVSKTVEENLWKSVKSLEETIILLEQSGKVLSEGNNETAQEYFAKAKETRKRSDVLRNFIFEQHKFDS
ncbi:two-component system chemotaxis response regulator CheB [Larkinella arboricola]|uniref:protein-glutamate methylesterase n=1 Tax=Larkinella arboricola TaxID=643671 RepID=A0A327X1W6_LARAB|nr:chemotaxis protein CheB [Larkinella arboricola]RAK00531.1 two-component system chemotaxis response regulator CheB [Larkinella arboricola]